MALLTGVAKRLFVETVGTVSHTFGKIVMLKIYGRRIIGIDSTLRTFVASVSRTEKTTRSAILAETGVSIAERAVGTDSHTFESIIVEKVSCFATTIGCTIVGSSNTRNTVTTAVFAHMIEPETDELTVGTAEVARRLIRPFVVRIG